MSARAAAVVALTERLGHAFADPQLLERALTHASVGEGARKVANSERLEFLGDRVLNLCIAEALFRRFPDAEEGDLALRLNGLVDLRTCAQIARGWGVGPALRLPAGETRRGAREQETLLGDACEAILAAVYVDAGLEAARTLILANWGERLDAPAPERALNPKSRLQHWALARGPALPSYELVERAGPEHALRFRVRAAVEGACAEGEGSSRRAAETAAAEALLAEVST